MIYETKDRWVYAAAFGALTGQIMSFILGLTYMPTVSNNEDVNNIFNGKKHHLARLV